MTWRLFDHENVCPFIGVSVEEFSPRYALVSPWMDNGNLMQYLKKVPQDYSGKLYMVRVTIYTVFIMRTTLHSSGLWPCVSVIYIH